MQCTVAINGFNLNEKTKKTKNPTVDCVLNVPAWLTSSLAEDWLELNSTFV